MTTKALVLVRTTPNLTGKTYTKLKELAGVKSFNTVTGRYDAVLTVEGNDVKDLSKFIVENIRTIDGIKDTETLVVAD